MSNKRRIGLVLLIAVLGFSCAPVLSPSLVPTLDPFAMNTAIALTSGAASAQTALANPNQPQVQETQTVFAEGPTLDANSFGTSVAQTVEAAGTQTAALIPNTLTPSVTPFPTETASITPSPTATFILLLPTKTNTPFPIVIPKSTATKKGKGGGGGGGGGGGRGGGDPKTFSCTVMGVKPANNTIVKPNQVFNVFWTVKNTGDDWDDNSIDLVPVEGNLITTVEGYDLVNGVSSGRTATLPGVTLMTPGTPGRYGTHWSLLRGSTQFCDLYLIIIVK